jgi:hypothetical protein
VIDRTLTGRATKELDIALEMDAEYIRRTWGSGDYEVYFHDSNQKFSQVSKTIFVLRDPEYPPVVDHAELVSGDPKNAGYVEGLKARGQWRGDGSTTMQESPAAAAAVNQMGKIAADAMARASEPRDEQLASGRSMEIMATGFEAAVKHIGAAAGGGGAANDRLMDMLLRRVDGAAGVDSQLGTVDKLMDFAEKLSARGGGGAAPSWVDSLMGRVPDLLAGVLQIMAMQRAAPAGPGPSLPAGTWVPAAAPAAAPAAVAPESQEVDAAMLASFGLPAEVGQFITVGRRAVHAYADGFSGSAFAESVDRLEGEQVYIAIASLGAAGILQVLRSLPAALLGASAAAVLASPQLVPWIEEFCLYGAPDEAAPGPELVK